MREPTFDTPTQRLDRLEREVRWWKVLGTAAAVALALVLLLGATGSRVAEEIRAKRIVIVDAKGKPRIELGDVGNRVRLDQASTLFYYPGLAIADEEGEVRVWLALMPGLSTAVGVQSHTPTLSLLGEKLNSAELRVLVHEGPRLELSRPLGKVIWKAP